jgi:hypothetical protein
MAEGKRAGAPGASHRTTLPAEPPESSRRQGLIPVPPLLELMALQREASGNGWTPEAYLGVARWCHRHRPQSTQLWLRLALEVSP